jgi:hypothetical protein
MTLSKIIVWASGVALLILIMAVAYIGVTGGPYVGMTHTTSYALSIMQVLMIPIAAVLTLFTTMIKEVILKKDS